MISHDNKFQLSTVETENGNRLQIQGIIKLNQHVRLHILANNISLCKTPPDNSSILNILEGQIEGILEERESSTLLQISCCNDILLTRITRKSYHQLNLAHGQAVFMQIKTISIH